MPMTDELEPTPARARRGCLRVVVVLLALAGALFIVGRMFVVQRIWVPEDVTYMSPALMPGAPAWVDKLSLRITSPRRGDIVAVAARSKPLGIDLLRVVALPGETVAAEDGKLLVDGAPVAESYARGELRGAFATRQVPRGHYLVLPDDRGAYGARSLARKPVSRQEIIGRILPASR
jgi:signal peptidase I